MGGSAVWVPPLVRVSERKDSFMHRHNRVQVGVFQKEKEETDLNDEHVKRRRRSHLKIIHYYQNNFKYNNYNLKF